VTVADRVRARLREEMAARGVSYRKMADRLAKRQRLKWTQSKVAKILRGRVELKVDDVAAFSTEIGMGLVEIVRDRGVDYCAELTPSELRLLDIVRARGPEILQSLIVVAGTADTISWQRPKGIKPAHFGLPVTDKSDTKRADRLTTSLGGGSHGDDGGDYPSVPADSAVDQFADVVERFTTQQRRAAPHQEEHRSVSKPDRKKPRRRTATK